MQKQSHFETTHSPQWDHLRDLLAQLSSVNPLRRRHPTTLTELPALHTQVCHHLALARSRGYSPGLVNRLHDLVLDSHRHLYHHKGSWTQRALRFVAGGFARLVRRHAGLFWICCGLFYLPALLFGLLCYTDPDFILRIHSSRQVQDIETMYDPGNFNALRPVGYEAAGQFQMFGYYIANNIAIDFRVFAGGVLFGIGTVFFVLFNALHIGSIAGHLSGIGYNPTFWGFVAGHSALELTALCISAMAGLLLGRALVSPGRSRRADALAMAAGDAARLIIGAALMTLAAAFIEAYWSSTEYPLRIKLSVGAAIWLLTIGYLWRAGRN